MANWNSAAHWRKVAMVTPDTGSASLRLSILKPVEKVSGKTTISYRGWNILLLVCYDLRFPVWSRNVNNEYDLLIYVANWPVPRRRVWDILLQARALENISYVCGVNRIGTDGNQMLYNGGSVIYSPKGDLLASVPDHEEGTATATLDLSVLREFRQKFPAWKDAECFQIKN